jgi:hypothetical protein
VTVRTLPRKGRGGFSLVEALIAVTLLVVVLTGAANVLRQAQGAYEAGRTATEIQSRCHRALHRIADDLNQAELGSLDPVPDPALGGDTLGYRHPAGADAGGIQWGPPMQVALELEEGEIADGLDNDGDGLSDESLLAWRRSPGTPDEVRAVWCRGIRRYLEGEQPNLADDNGNGLIDERGLAFQLVGDVLTIRLSVELMDINGNPITGTAQTSVRIRN